MTTKQARKNIIRLVKLARDHKIEYSEFQMLMTPPLRVLENNGIYIQDVIRTGTNIYFVYSSRKHL